MKNILLLIALVFAFLLTADVNAQNYLKDRFSVGTYNFLMRLDKRTTADKQNYNDLSFNSQVCFTYRGDDDINNRYIDGFLTDPSYYLTNFSNTLLDIFITPNSFHKQKILFERAKVIRGALGQRSTYQAENHGTYQTKFPGYGYNYSQTGMDYAEDPDNIGTVAGRRCITGTHSAGYMVYGLYENMEQINYPKRDNSGKTSMEYYWSDNKDDLYFWVVKPRMKIKVEDFNDPNKKEMNVVRIDIVGYLYPLDPIYIKVKDFGDYFQNYNGVYKEDFYTYITEFNYTPTLKVLAINLLKNMPDFDNSNKDAILQASQVDYKVYWCGNVDVWLDYVRVDDEWAHFLFTDPNDNATGNRNPFHQKIQTEINALTNAENSEGLAYLYLDEYAYNNIPCIAEVNRLVKCINPVNSLTAMTSEFALKGPGYLRNIESPNHTDRHFFDTLLSSGAVTDVLIEECYPFENFFPMGSSRRFVYYPPTLDLQQSLAGGVSKYYYQAPSAEQYNEDVNKKLENDFWYYYLGVYRKCAYMIKKAKSEGKDISLSMSIQNHTFEQKLGEGWVDEYGLRDVTNEEVSMQSYLALIYGAKQIMDYCYHSDPPVQRSDGIYYNNGLIYYNGDKRLTNYYGQQKWDFLCSLNVKLRQIGEILYPTGYPLKHFEMDEARTINDIFSDFHPDYDYGLPFKYISDILSIYPGPTGSFLDNNTDPSEKRYWEVGTFLPPSSIYEEKFSKYFIMLNKRCTPPKENVSYGDVRHLKIKFDPNELPGFNNWVLIDPLTNNVITAINKNSGTYYYAGEFQPGEGRLFKLAPVMQEGGTFVCDEEVLGQSFVCKGMVESGQYNLSIENSQINFMPQGQLKA